MNNLRFCFAAALLVFFLAKPAAAQSVMDNLPGCLALEDMTKERLDCYDTLVPPTPSQKRTIAKAITDCKFVKEQDERLTCFNRFLQRPPSRVTPSVAPKRTPRS